jgi:hypothetical protein
MTEADARYIRLTQKWGVPDPRSPKAYPSPEVTSPIQWAWELLRRRADFRTQWQDEVMPFTTNGEFNIDAWDQKAEEIRRKAIAQRHPYSPEPPHLVLARQFRVSAGGNIDPRRSHPPAIFDAPTVILFSWLAPLGSAPIPEEFTCLVRIDVSLPLRSQWAAIK